MAAPNGALQKRNHLIKEAEKTRDCFTCKRHKEIRMGNMGKELLRDKQLVRDRQRLVRGKLGLSKRKSLSLRVGNRRFFLTGSDDWGDWMSDESWVAGVVSSRYVRL